MATPQIAAANQNLFLDSRFTQAANAGADLFSASFGDAPQQLITPYGQQEAEIIQGKQNIAAQAAQGDARTNQFLNDYQNFGTANMGRSYETDRLIDDQRDALRGARVTDPVIQQVLDRRIAEQNGFTPQEMQAMREQNMGGLNRALQTSQRSAMGQANSQGVSGGAAGALGYNGQREFLQGAGDLERDIFLSNIAERNNRLQSLQGLATEVDNTRYGRTTEARNRLQDFTTQAQNNEWARGNQFLTQGASMSAAEAQRNLQNTASTYGDYANTVMGFGERSLGIQKDNLAYQTAYRQGLLNNSIAGGSYAVARRDQEEAEKITREGYKAQVDAARAGKASAGSSNLVINSGGGGSSGGGGNEFAGKSLQSSSTGAFGNTNNAFAGRV